MSRNSHFVVIPDAGGQSQRVPLKTWLRANPGLLPAVDPTSTQTHALRAMLRRLGWRQENLEHQVLLFAPEIGEAELSAVVNATAADEEPPESDPGLEDDLSFELEHQLRDFLISNLPSLVVDGRRLRLFHDPSGKTGSEYRTEVGYIDILAVDDAGALYVFELKRARTSDQTIGQLLRYMGWCQRHLANGHPVNGVLVAQSFSDKVKYAALAVPRVHVFEYRIAFTLSPAVLS